jgi:hypothetical protein
MKTFSIACMLVLGSIPAHGQFAPYWIGNAGCQKELIFEDSLQYTASSAPHTLTWAPYWGQVTGYYSEGYIFDEEGDLCKTRADWLDESVSHSPQMTEWDPPLKILDYPLTAGKTWTSESRRRTNQQGLWWPVTLTVTVIGPQTVETGIGQLDVLEISMDGSSLFLHEILGDVAYLVSISGCDVVATEEIAWGTVKSIYR